MDDLISVCIPTFNRPALLEQAIESCFAQAHRDLEILVGDDSEGAESERLVSRLAVPSHLPILYERNIPPRGQSGNVNRLFDRAHGRRLILLHDDDLLCPNGLDILAEAWAKVDAPACVYGCQMVIAPDGFVLEDRTRLWNERYSRKASLAGPQSSAMVAALQQQVPNNAYLIATSTARAIRYRPETEVGQSVDAEFVLRVAEHASQRFVFVDQFVSKYRLTPFSIARSTGLNRREDLFYEAALRIDGDKTVEDAKAALLSRISVGAALDAAMMGRRWFALRIIFSQVYSKPLISRWTLYRLFCVVSPRWATALRAWLKVRLFAG